MKISSVIGSITLFLICVVLAVAGIFWFWPQATVRVTGFGPYDVKGIALYCALLVIAVGGTAWAFERLFERAGKTGLYVKWRSHQQADYAATASASHADEEVSQFVPERVAEQLNLRYGRLWKHKVSILLVQGHDDEIEKAVPGLKRDLWQESDGIVLMLGGDPQSPPNAAFLSALRQLRPRYPLDGIVQVINISSLPSEAERDAFLRSRQKADKLLGWQAPVWLWLTDKADGSQDDHDVTATGTLFGPGATPEEAVCSLDKLIPRLRKAGMVQVLKNSRHDWLLRLSSRLQSELKARLAMLLTGLMQGPAPYRLRGIMLSPERVGADTAPHVRLSASAWQELEKDIPFVAAKKLTFDWLKGQRLLLLALVALWGVGTLLSLTVNRAQIYQVQKMARIAADTKQPLAERLRNQLILQQAIARLQNQQASRPTWYSRFGLNQDRHVLAALWPLYARNNAELMRDTMAEHFRLQLAAFVQLPPASHARTQKTQPAYKLLKGYLMLARPDKANAVWLSKNMMTFWPTREGVPDGVWRALAPKMLGFYAQNLPLHPEWKIKPDAQLISTVRQILLKQIGQRNAEPGLYQEMLKRIASNWPDLTLADMTGDTDVSTLFTTDKMVPGMFTRQAWEEQVQDAIDDLMKTRRDEIDWVLTDKTHQPDNDVSPEALKARLTERYFTDFGNAWLNMVNSIHWQEATSLSEAVAQLDLVADVRRSPLVALMNTLVWQGKTGQKSEALADSIVDSAKKLLGREKKAKQLIEQIQGPRGPLDGIFGPLMRLMEGKDGTGSNGNLSFHSWLARITQVRLKLQQVTSAPDPKAMSQMLAQSVFQGKTLDLTDNRDYGGLVAASLGQQWSGFGQSLFVQPLDRAWRQVLVPAAGSLNAHWQTTIVDQWNKAFAGRYPFKATGADASLPLLAKFLRSDSGRITTFLKTNLGGILNQEGNRWVVNPAASQGIVVNPAFLSSVNQLAEISDVVFAQGDAAVHFELMARPSRDVARMQLTLDQQNLDYFNQMESWQSFVWPGDTYYPGISLSWHNVNTGMQLYDRDQGNWGFIRLLGKALIKPLDGSRTQLVWKTPEGDPLKFVMRTELGAGPLALLKLQGSQLPESIFIVD